MGETLNTIHRPINTAAGLKMQYYSFTSAGIKISTVMSMKAGSGLFLKILEIRIWGGGEFMNSGTM